MWSKGQGIRHLHFSDVPESGGTLTFDLLKTKCQRALIIEWPTALLLPSFHINLYIYIYVYSTCIQASFEEFLIIAWQRSELPECFYSYLCGMKKKKKEKLSSFRQLPAGKDAKQLHPQLLHMQIRTMNS